MKVMTETVPPCLLSEGNIFQGTLQFKSETSVYCSIEGEVHHEAKEKLYFGKTSFLKGKITSVGPVIIEGKVLGDIISDSLIQLTSTAIVCGLVKAPHIQILPGAQLEGSVFTTKKKQAK